MTSTTTVKYNNVLYMEADYVFQNAPIYCKSCKNIREVIRKKKIDASHYIFLRKNETNQWVLSDGRSYKFDRVFFLKTFVDAIPELHRGGGDGSEEKNADNERNNDNREEEKTEEPPITDENGVEKAPPLIILDENEMFHDEDGRTFEIETRGKRNHKEIFFRIKDVEKCFDMKELQHTVIRKDTRYREHNHYKYFIVMRREDIPTKENKNLVKKEVFLTYKGMLRVLFASENNKADKFQDWATEILFTHQMGTPEQKAEMVSTLKEGLSYDDAQRFCAANASKLPCLYLTAFNTVGKLRDKMQIDRQYLDSSIVYKFGITKDFESRKNGHKQEYKELEGLIEFKLIYFAYIDPIYLNRAETELKELLAGFRFEWNHHNELLIVPPAFTRYVKKIYDDLAKRYCGNMQDVNAKMEELKEKYRVEREAWEKELAALKETTSKELTALKEKWEGEIANLRQIHALEKVNWELEMINMKHIHQLGREGWEKEMKTAREMHQMEVEHLCFKNETMKENYEQKLENVHLKMRLLEEGTTTAAAAAVFSSSQQQKFKHP